MSEVGKLVLSASTYSSDDAAGRRTYAVAAALEVVMARAASMNGPGQLEAEMDNLSRYADRIQEALEGK
jgi:hypothetical protein